MECDDDRNGPGDPGAGATATTATPGTDACATGTPPPFSDTWDPPYTASIPKGVTRAIMRLGTGSIGNE